MKRKFEQIRKVRLSQIVYVTFLIVGLSTFHLYSCGGGVVPYIPSGTGAGSGSSSSGQFFLFDKGVTSTMLDYRAVQPLFKNIVNSGNERKVRGLKDKKKERCDAEGDSTVIHDSTKTAEHNLVGEDALPVLNLHKLH